MNPPDLTQKAISAALAGSWKEAIKINLLMLKTDSKDIETLNRLARAYLQTGQKTLAQKTYDKVLRLDKYNPIATKNMELLKTLKISRAAASPHLAPASPHIPIFLEEPGVTKNISLIRLGDPKIITRLHPGDAVLLVCRQHNVVILSSTNEYLGRLPDDIASRLRVFLKAGNAYSAWIRSVDSQSLRVFLKEDYRAPKYRHTPSFPLTEKLAYAAFTPPELIHEEKPDVSATEFQEEDSRPTAESEPEPEPQP